MMARCRSLSFLGFPKYKIGENGSVWSSWDLNPGCWKKMKPRVHPSRGHLYVDLYKGNGRGHKRFFVHRLVLEAFVGPCPPGMQCRHFPDSNPVNNWVNNLQWGTQSENEVDKKTHGTSNDGVRNGMSKHASANIKRIRRLYATGNYTQEQVARICNTTQGWVSEVVRFKKRKAA